MAIVKVERENGEKVIRNIATVGGSGGGGEPMLYFDDYESYKAWEDSPQFNPDILCYFPENDNSKVYQPSFVGMYVEASNLPTLEAVKEIFGPNTEWERVQGRMTIASGSGTDTRNETMNFATGATGGEYKHQLSIEELAKHRHSGVIAGYGAAYSGAGAGANASSTDYEGQDEPHNNLPPYIVVDKWHRTE